MKKNILLIILILILTIVAVDYYRYTQQRTPLFAVSFGTNKDGGTKEYYGLGYKVIKYNVLGGRKDMVFGFITLKYDAENKNDDRPYCEFKVTYNVAKIIESNDEKYLYLTLTEFQTEGATTVKYDPEKFGSIEEGKNYEFTFKTLKPDLKDKIDEIFANSQLLTVDKTAKQGLEIEKENQCFAK